MLDKNLLATIFLELTNGKDMVKFSEINKLCYRVYHLLFQVCKTYRRTWSCLRKTGEPHGLSRSWYQNGQLCYETNFYQGAEHGLYQFWSKQGLVCCHIKFHYGVPLQYQYYDVET